MLGLSLKELHRPSNVAPDNCKTPPETLIVDLKADLVLGIHTGLSVAGTYRLHISFVHISCSVIRLAFSSVASIIHHRYRVCLIL